MTAENCSVFAAKGRELWSLRDDVTLEGDSYSDLMRLCSRWGDVTIRQSSRLVRETLQRMGLGPISLENAMHTAATLPGGTSWDSDEARAQLAELYRCSSACSR